MNRTVAIISTVGAVLVLAYAIWVNGRAENTSATFGLLFVGLGAYVISGAGCDWDWFMESRPASTLVALCSRTGARLVYGVLGVLFVLMGLWIQVQ